MDLVSILSENKRRKPEERVAIQATAGRKASLMISVQEELREWRVAREIHRNCKAIDLIEKKRSYFIELPLYFPNEYAYRCDATRFRTYS